MPIETFSAKSEINRRYKLTSIILIINALVWYYYAFTFLQDIIKKVTSDYFATFLMWSIHFGGITFSALIGASLTEKIGGRTRFLILWMIIGVISSLASVMAGNVDIPGILTISFLLGISLGLGMPNCMGYYVDLTHVESRGRFGGIIMLATGLGMFFLGVISIESVGIRALILTFWRLAGLAIFLLIKPPEKIMEKKVEPTYKSILSERPFILYLIPWIMFSLVNYLSISVQLDILGESLDFLAIIGNGLTGVSAIVGGFLADIVGRKRVAIIGFILLGLSYSILGIYPESVLSWYFYTVIEGIAWGVLFMIFVVTIWGDFSYNSRSDKYYALGVLPFFISRFLSFVIGEQIGAIVSAYAIFSFTAFFLFLAVLPLMFAPETLPEKAIRERELKQYIEKAKKIKEKLT